MALTTELLPSFREGDRDAPDISASLPGGLPSAVRVSRPCLTVCRTSRANDTGAVLPVQVCDCIALATTWLNDDGLFPEDPSGLEFSVSRSLNTIGRSVTTGLWPSL